PTGGRYHDLSALIRDRDVEDLRQPLAELHQRSLKDPPVKCRPHRGRIVDVEALARALDLEQGAVDGLQRARQLPRQQRRGVSGIRDGDADGVDPQLPNGPADRAEREPEQQDGRPPEAAERNGPGGRRQARRRDSGRIGLDAGLAEHAITVPVLITGSVTVYAWPDPTSN